MNQHTPFNESILLDRLVDGELSGSERRQLLESFDTRPEGWRRCALAFLEAQSWRDEIGPLARDSGSETSASERRVSDFSPIRKSPWATGVSWLAIAACLLLAFGLGRIERQQGFPIAERSSDSSRQVASVNPPGDTPSLNAHNPNDAVTLFVQGDDGRRHPVRVPLVDAGTLDKQLGVQFQSGLTDDVRNELKDKGYAVRSKRQYAPLWLEKKRPANDLAGRGYEDRSG